MLEREPVASLKNYLVPKRCNMPSEKYLHQHPDFSDLIRVVAGERKIDPYLAEKDYWLMHCLYGLKEAGYDFQLKGGTSLSKGYGIIHRFSEDIDIHIAPPHDMNVRTSKIMIKRKTAKAAKTITIIWPKHPHRRHREGGARYKI